MTRESERQHYRFDGRMTRMMCILALSGTLLFTAANITASYGTKAAVFTYQLLDRDSHFQNLEINLQSGSY